ncbi:MAG: transketolase [Fusobacteriaceae bacterium]|nr:transketolase [Fusobacteriaceae bacterium]
MTSEELAWRIRRHAIEMTHLSHGSHIGSILSIADMVAVLYNDIMRIYPNDPKNDKRDRFILSKGHAGAAIYAALAEKGFFEIDELKTHYSDGSRLSGHVSHKNVPGVELSTGSLGQGVCVAAGMAMAAKKDKKTHRIFAITGDGECDEGSVWEMALFSNHYKLSNLTIIVDHNKMQSLDTCENTLKLLDLATKWKAFGWNVKEVDGHNHKELYSVLKINDSEKPMCVIAHTIKGKGISFMENQILWHYRDPQGEYYTNAVDELERDKK